MMQKTKYIEIRNDYNRKAKDRFETRVQLDREYSELSRKTETLRSELNAANQLCSKLEYDISCNKKCVKTLKNGKSEMEIIDDKLNKAWDELRRVETTGKVLADIMRSSGKQRMEKMIDDWIQQCTIYLNQTK